MRIVHLTAGAGGMYCGGCLHGNSLAAALQAAGQEVLLAPLYTPIRTDEEDVSIDRVAFGGINVYLQQRWGLFRRTPSFLDRLWDHPALLRWFSRRSAGVRAEQLGALTISMLQGAEGRQRKELDRLIRWLEEAIRPGLVHLSNVLLVGIARQIVRRLGVPVVCTLAGEDVFLQGLPAPYAEQAWALLREQCRELAALVALNRYYADFMAGRLGVRRERIEVIPAGLNLTGHASPGPPRRPAGDRRTASIGYLARICPEKGLLQLVEAFILLARQADLPPVRLQAAGYLHSADRPYLDRIRARLAACGLSDRFEYLGELDRATKIAFLQSLDMFSLPTVCRESKGLPVLEAWANGVPVVLPAHGAFPELVEDTGGGLLCEPGSPLALAEGLRRLIRDPELAAEYGRRAQQAVHQRYNAEVMARRMIELYGKLLTRG